MTCHQIRPEHCNRSQHRPEQWEHSSLETEHPVRALWLIAWQLVAMSEIWVLYIYLHL